MADPLSVAASVLAVMTAAIKSTKSLRDAVGRYKKRDRTLGQLHEQLDGLIKALGLLSGAAEADAAALELLRGPVDRCSQICAEFEVAMARFDTKQSMGLKDWAKMEFMGGDIKDFTDNLASYKLTISIHLGALTMQHTKVSQELLEEYNETIQEAMHNLQVHLQRIDGRLELLVGAGAARDSHLEVDLQDERAVTQQCLGICYKAMSCLEALQDQPPLSQPASAAADGDAIRAAFEAERLTSQALGETRDRFLNTIQNLQERLDQVVRNESPGDGSERARLLDDISASRQCLEVCKLASEVSTQKVHMIGEVAAGDDTDQMVVTTLADLFDVRKVVAKSRSAQFVGSTTAEALQHIATQRYGSRFGAGDGMGTHRDHASRPREAAERAAQPLRPGVKPTANEVKRRSTPKDGED